MESNRIEDEGLRGLMAGLKGNTTLTELDLHGFYPVLFAHLTKAYLSDNSIEFDVSLEFVQTLFAKSVIKKLDLYSAVAQACCLHLMALLDNRIDDARGAVIAEVLKENKSITELILETMFKVLFACVFTFLQKTKSEMKEERLLQMP